MTRASDQVSQMVRALTPMLTFGMLSGVVRPVVIMASSMPSKSPRYYTDTLTDVEGTMRYCGMHGCTDLGVVFGNAIARVNGVR